MLHFQLAPRFALKASAAVIAVPLLISCTSNPVPDGPQVSGAPWRVKFPGGDSTPVLEDETIYAGSEDGSICAFNAITGETKWRFLTDTDPWHTDPSSQRQALPSEPRSAGQLDPNQLRGTLCVSMTPIVANEMVFVGSCNRAFYSLDAATGKKNWSYAADNGLGFFGAGSVPVLQDGTIYLTTEAGLHAVDANSGMRKWLFETLQEIPRKDMNLGRKRTPDGPVISDGIAFVTAWPLVLGEPSRRSFVYAVSCDSGTAKWTAKLDGIAISAPLVAKGLVLVAIEENEHGAAHHSRPRTMYALDVVDGKTRWKIDVACDISARKALIAGDSILFATDTNLVSVNLDTGRSTWKFSDSDIASGLAADDTFVYVGTHKGTFAHPIDTIHALDRVTGRERWSQNLGGSIGDFVVHGGVVYAGRAPVHVMDAATGNQLLSFTGTGRESVKLVSERNVYLSCSTTTYSGMETVEQGYLYAFPIHPSPR